MRSNPVALIALAALTLVSAARAEKTKIQAIDGGLSGRLSPVRASLSKEGGNVRAELGASLEKSRAQAHKMIDDVIDSGNLETWLDAMEKDDQDGFAASLRGKPTETVRAALHSRLERTLAKLGKTIDKGLTGQDPSKVKASLDLALKDLAREETNLMEAAVAADLRTEKSPEDEEEGASPAAPKASYQNYGHGGVRGYNAQMSAGMTPAQQRTLQVASQRAWFSNQLGATQWNNRVNTFNRYLYGRSQPRYSDPRYRRVGFPAGYYYRPDRVERVVKRGLWGAAAVAATPFALLGAMFR